MELKVFLAMPYTGTVNVDAFLAGSHFACEDKERYKFFPLPGPGGSHCENFNRAWCMALNNREKDHWTHFGMIHSDVEPENGWLDILLDEIEKVQADVLSVVLPIKDKRGITSTALLHRETLFNHRITMRELGALPMTFNAAMAGEPNSALLLSSGLWICRFTEPWVEQPYFEMRDRIVKMPDGKFLSFNFSEDWNFSLQCYELGLKLFATKKVKARHHGPYDYVNWRAWGGWETDQDGSYGEWLNQLGDFPKVQSLNSKEPAS